MILWLANRALFALRILTFEEQDIKDGDNNKEQPDLDMMGLCDCWRKETLAIRVSLSASDSSSLAWRWDRASS